MELREIPVEDIYPDEKNPRKDFGNIEALAESCMLNALNPGEPVNPIVVVADGGIYRIVDGERRYKAMQANKLTNCHAIVCDGMDEANAMIAMITTDDKQQLSEIERSRGVQQMLLLGVEPDRVERVGRMAKGSAVKVSRARQAVDDAGDDMTLERMIVIAEFDEAGDDDAVVRLTNCSESSWHSVRYEVERERNNIRRHECVKSACSDMGVELLEKAPRGSRLLRSIYNINSAEDVKRNIENENGTDIVVVASNQSMSTFYDVAIYSKPEEVNDKEAAKIASYNSLKRSMTLDKRRRAKFVAEKMLETGMDGLAATGAALVESAKGAKYTTAKFCELAGIESVPVRPSEWLIANRWDSVDNMTQDELAAIANGRRKGDSPSFGKHAAEKFAKFLEALVADGYEASVSELALLDNCHKTIKEAQ